MPMSSRAPTRRFLMNRAEWFIVGLIVVAALAVFFRFVLPFAWMVARLFFVTAFTA